MTSANLQIIKPDDMHIHLRQGDRLQNYVKDAAQTFGRAIVMPNTTPPIDSPESVQQYRKEIEATSANFKALMTFKIHREVTAESVKDLQKAGCISGKLYPAGVTTNSQDGISEIEQAFDIFAALEELNMPLNVHAEEPGAFSLNREKEYLPQVEKIRQNFPRLRIVLEHISDRASVDYVQKAPENVAATITVHHLDLTLDNIIGGHLQPHHFCKPVPKTPEDRQAILEAALSGNPKFFLGTDSAPHLKEDKESAMGCAGIYSAPVALPVLAEIFEKHDVLDRLEAFTSKFGCRFYELPENTDKLQLEKKSWNVPMEYHGVVPFKAGETLLWNIS